MVSSPVQQLEKRLGPRPRRPEWHRLHELLQRHGDNALRGAFERGLREQAIGAEYIAHYLAHPPLCPTSIAQELSL